MIFENRIDAGQQLAALLKHYTNTDAVILALPRGGVPVANEIAQQLHLPLDVCLVRKLGVPGNEELAMGAIAENDVRLFDQAVLQMLPITESEINRVIEKETHELERRIMLYRKGKPMIPVKNKTVLLVDDGLATGSTMKAALMTLKKQHPKKIIVVVPVAPPSSLTEINAMADEVVCPIITENFWGVGGFYRDFSPTSDEEVCDILAVQKKG